MQTHADPWRATAPLLVVGLLIACGALAGCTKDGPADWKTTTMDDRFSFQMPGEPKEQFQKQDTPAGMLNTRFYELSLDKGARVYSFMTVDLPPKLAEPKGKEIEERLEAAQQGALANAKGKLLESKKIEVAGFSGRDCLIEIAGVGIGRMRIAWVRRTLIVLEVINVNSKDADRFFDSLKLLKDSPSSEAGEPKAKTRAKP